jgi:hypothetical protein
VFQPAVADLQEELADAGVSGLRRAVTRCRWYCALLRLLLVVGLTMPSVSAERAVLFTSPRRSGGWFLFLLAAALYTGTWPFFGWFVAAALPAGLVLAVTMRAWHDRHPDTVPRPATPGARAPEINLSAIPVGGDVAGLMFALGSVAIVLVGLPTLWWFVAAVVIGSVLVAVGRLRASNAPRADHAGTSVYHR